MNDKRAPLEVVETQDDQLADEKFSVVSAHTEAERTKSDSEPPAFNPYAFSTVTVPPDLRLEMLQAKLPRLDPEYFEDTIPPNQVFEAPPKGGTEQSSFSV